MNFPSFWSVLKGDLSLVGPRPERPELIKRSREEVLYYNGRHSIIPGMTGWAPGQWLPGGYRPKRTHSLRYLLHRKLESTSGHPDYANDLLSLGRSALIALRSWLAAELDPAIIILIRIFPLFAEWSESF